MVNMNPNQGPTRFNVLLTEDRPRTGDHHWTGQFARLLEPQGVRAIIAPTAHRALEFAESEDIHAAVIDLAVPYGEPARAARAGRSPAEPSGFWLVELIRRLPQQPPIVILRTPAFSQKQAQQHLQQALKLGAFSVLSKPVHIEQILAVFQRVVERQYRGAWPPAPPRIWQRRTRPSADRPNADDASQSSGDPKEL